jgi:hypothetical protein
LRRLCRFIAAAPLSAERLRAQAQPLEAQLADGRRFLLGVETPRAGFRVTRAQPA